MAAQEGRAVKPEEAINPLLATFLVTKNMKFAGHQFQPGDGFVPHEVGCGKVKLRILVSARKLDPIPVKGSSLGKGNIHTQKQEVKKPLVKKAQKPKKVNKPKKAKSVPKKAKSVPKKAKSVPKKAKSVPKNVTSAPVSQTPSDKEQGSDDDGGDA